MDESVIGFWQGVFSGIDWTFFPSDIAVFIVLILWLWGLWPAVEVRQLIQDPAKQTQILIATIVLTGLWLLNANVTAGIHVHFLGLIVLMLMYGWRLASLIALLPTLFFAVFVFKHPADFAIYALLGVCLPIFGCFILYSQMFKYLPRHLFIYIFCGAFLNGFLSILLHVLAWSVWLLLTTDYSWQFLSHNYLVIIPLLGFPEALLNGMAITLLVVYRPEWLYDYSDRTYLWKK
ncbi:energy-coupling factor ABC transporter permease [Shewanella pneumatophori]|uniref:Energy-coupling factor ABC transporter permease n=1 Tax=Shewanella pneumatophori TaxID=314092 RepID=A0A9X2CIT5_9GAMM|nr:energy-coupling factor ABC transporter permease [Shewanella pneumatophori]MCL1139789.1 energy-coupling factor ABC transporter permease [Shewanella pneumatophori]